MSDSATATFGLAQIGQIAVPVSDIDRAIAFYRDTLGMRFLFRAPPGLGFFDCAGIRLMLDAPAKAQAENYSSVIYYKVPDLHAAFETLTMQAPGLTCASSARPRKSRVEGSVGNCGSIQSLSAKSVPSGTWCAFNSRSSLSDARVR